MIRIIPINKKWEIPKHYEDIPNFKTFEEFLAKSFCEEIKRVVIKQKYRWKALNPDYLKFKQRTGRNTGKWISSGLLIKSLRFRKYGTNSPYFCIFFKPDKDLDLNFIARCNEYGTITIPARPLFRRTLKKYKADLPKHYAKYLASAKSSHTQRGL